MDTLRKFLNESYNNRDKNISYLYKKAYGTDQIPYYDESNFTWNVAARLMGLGAIVDYAEKHTKFDLRSFVEHITGNNYHTAAIEECESRYGYCFSPNSIFDDFPEIARNFTKILDFFITNNISLDIEILFKRDTNELFNNLKEVVNQMKTGEITFNDLSIILNSFGKFYGLTESEEKFNGFITPQIWISISCCVIAVYIFMILLFIFIRWYMDIKLHRAYSSESTPSLLFNNLL